MTRERIKQEADTFFEWPSDKREMVTLTSCLFFAKHISDLALKEVEDALRENPE